MCKARKGHQTLCPGKQARARDGTRRRCGKGLVLLLAPLLFSGVAGHDPQPFFVGGGVALLITLCTLPFGLRFFRRADKTAPLPELTPSSFFSPDAVLNKKKCWLMLPLSQFCRDEIKLKIPELAELIGTYVNAGAAWHLLQQRFEQDGELNAG